MPITKDKFMAKSKTLQGIVLMLIPAIATLVGFEWTGEDGAAVNDTINAALAFIGAAWSIIGRFTAKTGIKVLP